MTESAKALGAGFHDVPGGHVAAVVTCLEMMAPPQPRPAPPLPDGVRLVALERPGVDAYRALYRAVGQDWLWFSRLVMPDAQLRATLDDARVEVFALRGGEADLGILELDFRQPDECELAFFGLTGEALGRGLGRAMMNEALARAWAKPIRRLWVHTCTLDSPAAVDFYRRSGFTAYARQIEIAPDPRLLGLLPRDCSPHVALIG
ncbi:MAG TPA: GNAT family N-acetyltransferase [Caulobacteraceae bacterium]|jgi:GNAT superfamily N-acetyltransferase|nr:GNAT family N-acetyltransferase [Caulobacteraceae bacterium]